MVAHLPYMQRVTGSNPVGSTSASVAQQGERLTCNQMVVGSIPAGGSSHPRVAEWETRQT
jgi:hypothetical protein